MSAREYNFDGLVGPTHNYAGLSPGNVASLSHGGQESHPRAAALQGLGKMRFVAGLGVGQAVLPPQPRPSLRTLRELGFSGTDEAILTAAGKDGGHLLRVCSSASSMWTANAATVAPSTDTADGTVHLTPANLQQMFHRAIEADTTHAVLKAIFADPRHFTVHRPLPGGGQFADEGAANHTRLFVTDRPAVHILAWGRVAFGPDTEGPKVFPARQTRESSEALARLHQLARSQVLLPRQDPAGIDGGAFHTDVLAVGNGAFLMLHEKAFVDHPTLLDQLRELLGPTFRACVAEEAELPLADAVRSYAFNSQVVTCPDGRMAIIAPEDARDIATSRAFLDRVIADDNPVAEVHYLDVRQSMDNGGGPACLRQRVVLNDEERAAIGARVFLDDALFADLEAWVKRYYRETLTGADLVDPQLARESFEALDALTGILKLGSIYDFQQA